MIFRRPETFDILERVAVLIFACIGSITARIRNLFEHDLSDSATNNQRNGEVGMIFKYHRPPPFETRITPVAVAAHGQCIALEGRPALDLSDQGIVGTDEF